MSGISLPKSVLKWVAVGLVVSSLVVGIITISSGITLSEIALLGYLPFSLAAAASLARLLVQNVRFRLIAGALTGLPRPDLGGAPVARMGSEFVALSTPAMIGGELVRAAWLSGRGVDGGKALWIGYLELLMDVYVGSALAVISAVFAFSRGATVIGVTIVAVAFISVVGYTVFFLIPAVRGIAKIPHRLFVFAEYFVGHERAKNFEVVAQERARTFSLAAASILRREALPLILKTAGLTVIQVLLSGLALWSILTAAGLKIDPLSSTLIAGGTSAIAAIPITIGGSGVVELTMLSYLSSVYGFSSWAAIVLWRVASYQVVLAVTGIAFLILTHRSTKAGVPKHGAENADVGHLEPPLSNTSQKTGSDIGASSARRFTADEVESEVVKLKTRFGVVKAIRFAIAGAVGFGVTEVVLTVGLLILFGNIPHARSASPALLGLDVLSLVIGVSAAFFINERITVHVPKSVKGEAADMFKRLLKFQAVSGIGNAGIIVVQLVLLATIDVSPVLGTVIGAAVTYPIVYYISIKYVWEAYRTR